MVQKGRLVGHAERLVGGLLVQVVQAWGHLFDVLIVVGGGNDAHLAFGVAEDVNDVGLEKASHFEGAVGGLELEERVGLLLGVWLDIVPAQGGALLPLEDLAVKAILLGGGRQNRRAFPGEAGRK